MKTTPITINDRIVKIARSFLGQQEKPGNSGFKSAEFERKMRAVGFHPGDAWCSYFAELVWKEAYNKEAYPKTFAIVDKLCSASATATFANYANSKTFQTSTNVPVLGAIVIWRHGNSWQGHAGIVTALDLKNNRFASVEGNTNNDGGREGYLVAEKPRKLGLPHNEHGLNLVGFIYPI